MIKIRSLRPGDIQQVLSLLNRYAEQESQASVLHKMQQLYIPLHRLSLLLPLNLQFLPAIFVAASQGKVLGLIWLSKDASQSRRWKIDHLILDPESCSYDVGTQLVNFVINRFGGEGVQTFLAYVDQYYNTGLALLKSCGFRRCGRLHAFVHNSSGQLQLPSIQLDGLRESNSNDNHLLRRLYNDSLPTEARLSLEKQDQDFERPLSKKLNDKLKGRFYKRWVVQDVARDHLIASIDISTADYREFYINVIVNAGWQHLYKECYTYAVQQALLITSSARIFTECLEFHKPGIETLEQFGFQRLSIAEILVKDYWIPIEDKGFKLQSPILLFSGKPSPATNLHQRY